MEDRLKQAYLQTIARNESSGGKNLNHQQLTSGPLAGQTAGGAYGIVPGSISDFVNKAKKHGMMVDPEIEKLASMPHEQVTGLLNTNRDLDNKVGSLYTDVLAAQNNGDVEMMALNHRFGQNYTQNDKPKLLERLKKNNENWYLDNLKKAIGNGQNREVSSEPSPEPSPRPNNPTPEDDHIVHNFSGEDIFTDPNAVDNAMDKYRKKLIAERLSRIPNSSES